MGICEQCQCEYTPRAADARISRFCSNYCKGQALGQRPKRVQSLADRFWSKVDKRGVCWMWTADLDRGGYGRIRGPIGGHVLAAHRVAYELTFGHIPAGAVIMHICDVRACVRPDHLRSGTIADNQRDMAVKGRHVGYRKLSRETVDAIRVQSTHGHSNSELAMVFGVDPSTISKALHRHSWR